MKCKVTKEYFPLYYYKELDKKIISEIESHMRSCRDCRTEFKLLKRTLKLAFALCCMVTVLSTGPGLIGNAGAESGHFPVYASIRPNVSFWIKIYSVYPSNQGVIHDKRNLDIIYDVIDLEYPDQPGSRKINRRRIKEIKKVYKSILKKLARGIPPSSPMVRGRGRHGCASSLRISCCRRAPRRSRCSSPGRAAPCARTYCRSWGSSRLHSACSA